MPPSFDTKALAEHLADAGVSGGDATSAPYLPGEVIASKYRLTRVLGQGGMGAVWLARNVVLDVDVAVKLVRSDVAAPEASARLLREARSAALLRHPSIVRIHDYGETERGDPFIVMEFLDGRSLGAVLARDGRLPARYAVQVFLPVAGALVAAHRRGIVHRDLKPDNIMLVTDERGVTTPKLVDFGIAKLKTGVVEHVTQTGAVLGSPDYMSPEQARGHVDVDERTDVWALCVTLYEAITGARPFDGLNYNALIHTIIVGDPAPITDHGAGDAELWTILARGLEKAPAARWQTVQELGEALAGWALGRGLTTDVTASSIAVHWLAEPPSSAGLASPRTARPYLTADTAPPPASPPASAESVAVPTGPTIHGVSTILRGGEAERPEERDAGRARKLWAGGVMAALALGALLAALLGQGSAPAAPEWRAAAAPAPTGPPPPTVVAGPTATASASAALPAAPSASLPSPPTTAAGARRTAVSVPRPPTPPRPAPTVPLPLQPNF